jgi:sulfoxide reductase heme-binding subunit YedZ
MHASANAMTKGPLWLRWVDTSTRGILSTAGIGILLVVGAFVASVSAEDGWRSATRYTVQLAYPFFLLAFTASSLARLLPGRETRALLLRRRGIGLAFAMAMGLHGLCILSLATFDEAVLVPGLTTVGGGLAYVAIGSMAATSNDAAVRYLGRKRWRALHRSGQVILFLVFLVTYGGRFAEDPGYWHGLALLLAALGLRVAAALQSIRLRRTTLPTE